MFTRAIVRKPGKSIVDGLRDTDIGVPDHQMVLVQHSAYVEALEACGLEVSVLEADESYPDSTFVEDTALLTTTCAIVTNPGAPSRKGEIHSIKQVLSDYYENLEEVIAPGTVDGGDIMMVGTHFYIGLSDRSNEEGARQVIEYLEKYGFSGSTMSVGDMLHLKSGVVYLENDTIAATGEFVHMKEFKNFRILEIDEEESYAANCLWVNGNVLVAKGYPKAARTIADAGYPVIELDVSEFHKLDGGLSCLSVKVLVGGLIIQ